MNSIFFWMAKPLAELALGLIVFILVLTLAVLCSLPRWIRQSRCQHLTVYETGACNAICRKCGKNLGFIGTWREKQKRSGA